jgi:hypothetical protein
VIKTSEPRRPPNYNQEMNLPPIELEKYSVREVSLGMNPDYDPEKHKDLPDDEGFQFMHYAKRIKKREWLIVLGVKLEPEGEGNSPSVPYFYKLEIVGRFKVHPRFPQKPHGKSKFTPKESDEIIKARMEINGPAMLYGIVREKIRSLSSSSGLGEILIPTVSFYKAKEVESKAAKPDTKPKPKRAPRKKK